MNEPDPVRPAPGETGDLVVRAQDGDQLARDALFGRYGPRLLRVVRRRMPNALRAHCESTDIMQQAFADAVRCFERFEWRGKRSFINWLAKIAQHRIFNMRDHVDRVPKLVHGEEVEAVDDRPAIDSVIVLEEIVEAVRRAVERLSPIHQEIIRLRYELDRPWQEVADTLGRPSADAVRQSHRLVLAKLLGELGRLYGDRRT